MKRFFIFMLFLFLCASVMFAGGQQSGRGTSGPVTTEKYPEYLNYDSIFPVMKPGQGQDVVLTAAIEQHAASPDFKQLWISKFIERDMNLKLEVEWIPAAALTERRNLMFAANDIPDILINLRLPPSDILKYGQISGQLLKLDDYIDEKLTPNIVWRFEQTPRAKLLSTTPDGHIYVLPLIQPTETVHGITNTCAINTEWLQACGLSFPRTLDEFMATLRVFKTQDPGRVGSDKVIPLAGSSRDSNPSVYILNALGFINPDSTGVKPTIRNDQVVIPSGDPLFREYLSIMNTMYKEGLIARNYFIEDQTEINGQMASGFVGVYPQNRVDTAGIDNWQVWEVGYPLISQWNPTPVWGELANLSTGNFAISSRTRYPQAALRFADVYYSSESALLWLGPPDGTELAMGHVGRTINSSPDSIGPKAFDNSKFPPGIRDNYTYVMSSLTFQPSFGTYDMVDSIEYYHVKYHGGNPNDKLTLMRTSPDNFPRIIAIERVAPYIKQSFPSIYYTDEATTLRILDLEAVISPYVTEQVANFIAGNRPISEFDTFQRELKNIGIDELLNIYRKVWDDYIAIQR